jgi:hypothetical protein
MTRLSNYFFKLRERWGVTTLWQFILIMLVFACTGFSILIVKSWIFTALGISSDISVWWRIMLFILVTLPTYHVLLLFYGFVFGQFRFFLAFEKRFYSRLSALFRWRKQP